MTTTTIRTTDRDDIQLPAMTIDDRTPCDELDEPIAIASTTPHLVILSPTEIYKLPNWEAAAAWALARGGPGTEIRTATGWSFALFMIGPKTPAFLLLEAGEVSP